MIAVGGFTPFTTVDYPGQHAAIVFCQGCPWRCPYCHNTHLQGHESPERSWNSVLEVLDRRAGLLDAVVFSGGEPLLQKHLPTAMRQVRERGYKVGLHTGGCDPERLQAVLPLVDWIGFDVKAPWDAYDTITRTRNSGAQAQRSLTAILDSGTPFEARTTVHPALTSPSALCRIDDQLKAVGVRSWIRQAFRQQGCAEPSLLGTARTSASHPLMTGPFRSHFLNETGLLQASCSAVANRAGA